MKHQTWLSIAPEMRAELREMMVSQLSERLDRVMAGALARRGRDKVARVQRAIAAASRLP